MTKRLFSFLRIFVSLSLILLLLYIMRDKYKDILLILRTMRISIFVLAFFTFLLGISVASLRLKIIVEAQELFIKFSEAICLTIVGYFFNNFLPTAIGGDVVKGYYLFKKTNEKMISYASVFVDRLIGLLTMLFMAFVAIIFAGDQVVDMRVKYIIFAGTIISALGLVFMANKSVARKFSFILFLFKPIEDGMRKAYNVIHAYRNHKILLLESLFMSITSQLLFFTTLGILAFSIGSRIPKMDLFVKTPIISFISLLPSINGLGLRESSTVVFFGPLIGKESAFAVSILWLFVLLLTSIIGGIVYILSPQFKIKIREISEREV